MKSDRALRYHFDGIRGFFFCIHIEYTTGMDSKKMVWVGMTIGGGVGSLIPLVWGASELSFSSIIFSGIGACIGIRFGFKMSQQ